MVRRIANPNLARTRNHKPTQLQLSKSLGKSRLKEAKAEQQQVKTKELVVRKRIVNLNL